MKKAFSNLKNLIINQNLLIFLILILASFLRLYRISDYMTFLGDEGRDVLVVYNILHGHLTLLGPTSSVGGFFLGPIYYYFMAPFLFLFNYNPVGPAIMVALIGVATVFLIYIFSKEIFNKNVALIAAFLYSISPIVISYSRSSWNPNPLPFFSLLILFLVYKSKLWGKEKYLFFVGILFGVAMQLHYLAVFLGVIILVYVFSINLIKSKKNFISLILKTVKDYLYIFLGFIIGWSPFLAFEIRHGFPDFRNIYQFILLSGNTGASGNYFQIVTDVFFRLFARLVFAFPQADQFHFFSKLLINSWIIFSLTIALLSVGLLIKNFYNSFKKKEENISKNLLLFLWIFIGVLLFGFYKKSIYEYYFAFMFPLPFILVASFIDEIKNLKKSKIFLVFSLAIFIILALLNLQGVPFRYPANRQLNQMRTIADFVMTKTNAKPFNFALISGGNSDYAYRYFFTIWNHPPVTIQYPGIDPKRTTVTDQLLVVCESPLPCSPVGNSLWEIAGFGRADIAGHWKVSVVEVYKLVHYKGK
ncbi:MAG TPA: glycosyltransferase family 39 protein [Candidatus Sulfotelmatobacter sp.]|nr:glycosyltransferase family 39 protein [Candidatus Sulfotelmatobacter sp.]